jgi:hypothetical protein
MQLDKARVEKVIAGITSNATGKTVLRDFFAEADESRTYRELGISKDYICYVLKCSD